MTDKRKRATHAQVVALKRRLNEVVAPLMTGDAWAKALFKAMNDGAHRMTLHTSGEADDVALTVGAALKLVGWQTRLIFTRPRAAAAWHCFVEARPNAESDWMQFDPYAEQAPDREGWLRFVYEEEET